MRFLFFLLFSFTSFTSVFCQLGVDNTAPYVGDLRVNGKQAGSATLLQYKGDLYLVTAKHVLENNYQGLINYTFYQTGKPSDAPQSITVRLKSNDKDQYIFFSESHDLAIIHIGFQGEELENGGYSFNNYSNVRMDIDGNMSGFLENQIWPYQKLVLGLDAYTIGYPSELERSNDTKITMSKGIVSGFYPNALIKCQLPVFGGNSGGPLFIYSAYSPSEFGQGTIKIGGAMQAYLAGIIVEFVPYIDGSISARGTGFQTVSNSGYAKVEPIDRVTNLIETTVISKRR
ncbi:MAG: serine protease [Lewinella sp.]